MFATYRSLISPDSKVFSSDLYAKTFFLTQGVDRL